MSRGILDLTVSLHKPHEKQLSFKRSSAKRKVIVAGRRGGKTTGVADIAVEAMLEDRRVLEAAPTSDQTNTFWDVCCEAMQEPIDAKICYKNETNRVLEMPNGGRIRTKTAWDADSLRGDYADLLILDEYSLMNPDTWDQVGAPMLLDNDGDAIFIFTPQRRNHAYAMYAKAQADDTGRWAAWHFTSYDNPYLSQEALAEITADMTDAAYRQEIMAEFLEGEGAVFRNIDACMTAPETKPVQHRGHDLVAGVDWGKKGDYTAISVGCRQCKCEVARDRFNQIDYHVQRGRLVAIAQRWGIKGMVPEANSMGEPIIDELSRDADLRDVHIMPFQTTATSKPPMIESLALALEREEMRWQPDPIWTAELESYEVKYSGNTNRPSYSAPAGVHDDTVMARALMLHGLLRPLEIETAPSLYQ